MSERPWNEGGTEKPYSVTLWYDKPGDSDGCMTGEDFATEQEARVAMCDLQRTFPGIDVGDVPYILLDGPKVHEVTTRTHLVEKQERQRERDRQEWQREIATEAGMGMGIHAYNDAMGYDSEPYDPDIHGDQDYNRDHYEEEV